MKASPTKYGIKINRRQPGRLQPGRDQRRHQPEGPGPRPRRARRRQLATRSGRTRRACSRPTRSRPGATSRPTSKDANGAWYNDYGGYISIGCDAAKVHALPEDLRRPARSPQYKGKVAINGNPTQAARRSRGVGRGAGQRRHAGQHPAGHRLLRQAQVARRLQPVDVTASTIESGQTPISIDWEYNNASTPRSRRRAST